MGDKKKNPAPPEQSKDYLRKRSFFQNMLTIYGRKPVLEAIAEPSVNPYRLHLAESNKPAKIIDQIIEIAKKRRTEILYHDKQSLSRISKNGKQDQGVALDIQFENLTSEKDFLEALPETFELIALDGITNPQNLGMIIRSVGASPVTGLLIPEKGSAKLDALTIKASAGTIFKAPIIRCANLKDTLQTLIEQGTQVITLDGNAKNNINNFEAKKRCVYVFGNETDGLSRDIKALATDNLKIPMQNGVESLNVAVAASLIAFRRAL